MGQLTLVHSAAAVGIQRLEFVFGQSRQLRSLKESRAVAVEPRKKQGVGVGQSRGLARQHRQAQQVSGEVAEGHGDSVFQYPRS